ncbi:hypothetical protein CB1_000273028 [Camelus ferus]|nr:hypothetical protein CB1_000273028 [Camelus ferus]
MGLSLSGREILRSLIDARAQTRRDFRSLVAVRRRRTCRQHAFVRRRPPSHARAPELALRQALQRPSERPGCARKTPSTPGWEVAAATPATTAPCRGEAAAPCERAEHPQVTQRPEAVSTGLRSQGNSAASDAGAVGAQLPLDGTSPQLRAGLAPRAGGRKRGFAETGTDNVALCSRRAVAGLVWRPEMRDSAES